MSRNPNIVNIGREARHHGPLQTRPPFAGNKPGFHIQSGLSVYPELLISQHRMIGGAGASVNFNSGNYDTGPSVLPVRGLLISDSVNGEAFSTQLIAPATIRVEQISDWVGDIDSPWAGKTTDCALVAMKYAPIDFDTADPHIRQEETIAPLLQLRALEHRGLIYHRVKVDGHTYTKTGIGSSIAFAAYYDRPLTAFNYLVSTRSRPLPSRNTLVYPWARSTIGVISTFSGSESGQLSALDEVIFIQQGPANSFGQSPSYGIYDHNLFSAIVRDPRNGNEFVTCAAVVATDHRPESEVWSGYLQSLAASALGLYLVDAYRASYLQVAIVSSPIDGIATDGFNNAMSRFPNGTPGRLSRGSSTDGNSAMALDYEEWDFAATCKREFLAVGVPYYPTSSGIEVPEGHLNVEKSQYNTPHFPDVAGIGSPGSMLPERESLPTSNEKPYYHLLGYNNALADLRTADFSLVMLKGLSLIAGNLEASDAASLAPVVLPADQLRFRFAGHNITGTTVRFEAISKTAGISYGRTQNAGAIPEFTFPAKTHSYGPYYVQSGTPQPSEPDLSGSYYNTDSVYYSGGFTSVLNLLSVDPQSLLTNIRHAPIVAIATDAGVPQGHYKRVYDWTVFLPPCDENAAASGTHSGFYNRGYFESQSFTAGSAYDEFGYLAGTIVHDLVRRTNTLPQNLNFPFDSAGASRVSVGNLGDVFSLESISEKSVLNYALFAVLPPICGHDYHCTANAMAGKTACAGLFSYNGAGPSETVSVAYAGRGVRMDSKVRTVDIGPLDNLPKYVVSDVTFGPADYTANVDVAIETEQVEVYVRWHSSLQGLGSYVPRTLAASSVQGFDADDHRGTISPYHYVRTSRAGELSPVLIAEMYFTARARIGVSSQWTFPDGFPTVQASQDGKRYVTDIYSDLRPLSEFDAVSNFGHPTTSNDPTPVFRHASQPMEFQNKMPFYAGTFVFNRYQTAALLRGEAVTPTRWMEFPEGDERGNEPQYLQWHSQTLATVCPSFTLQMS
jgi:hypothetical protein